MTTLNATRTASSLIRAGFNVRTNIRKNTAGRYFPSEIVATKGIAVLSASHNGGSPTDLVCLHVKRRHEQADSMTDYFPGAFCHTLKGAMEHADYINGRA